MDKEDVVHTYNGILLSHQKNEIMPFVATWMDLKIIILSEVSQKEKDILYDATYMWNLKCDTNEPIYKTETDSQAEIRLVVAKGRGRGMDWEFGVSRCKSDGERQILFDITYRWNLKNNTDECICKTETDSQI